MPLLCNDSPSNLHFEHSLAACKVFVSAFAIMERNSYARDPHSSDAPLKSTVDGRGSEGGLKRKPSVTDACQIR
jgi:hypothetical protein